MAERQDGNTGSGLGTLDDVDLWMVDYLQNPHDTPDPGSQPFTFPDNPIDLFGFLQMSSNGQLDTEDFDLEATLNALGPAPATDDGDASQFNKLFSDLLPKPAWNPSSSEHSLGQTMISERFFPIEDSLFELAQQYITSPDSSAFPTLSPNSAGPSGSSSAYHLSLRNSPSTGASVTEPDASVASSTFDFPRLYLTDDERWTATLARDVNAEGHFFYCVLTTRIYCRPVCQSRRPDRKNVAFVLTGAEARERGCRPCKRCKPDADVDPTSKRQVEAVEQLQRALLSEADDPDGGSVTLNKAAEEMGVSMWHLNRLFKRLVGEPPMVWAKAQKAQRSKRSREAGEDEQGEPASQRLRTGQSRVR